MKKAVQSKIQIKDNRSMYIIENENGFYNGEDQFFYPNMGNATFTNSEATARGIINKFGLKDVIILPITEEDFIHAKASVLSEILVLSSILKMKITNDTKHAFKFFGGKKKGFKKLLLNMENALLEIDKEFSILASANERNEESMYDVQAWYDNIIQFIATHGYRNSDLFSEIIEALKKDKKSLIGIVKKINKTK